MKKKICIYAIIILVIVFISLFVIYKNKSVDVSSDIRQIKLGDKIVLNDEYKEILRNQTIKNINSHLKSPNTAEYEEKFRYNCEEENIIKVFGYVDSQNSFGAMLRGYFECQYFAIDGIIDTTVYIKYDDTEILNIKDLYIKNYKDSIEKEKIQQNGNKLNQEKLDFIKEKFNGEEWNDVGKIKSVTFDTNESIIDVDITAKSVIKDADKQYWIYHNIISIIDYIKDFEDIGKVKINLYLNDKKIAEATFDEDFLKNKWKDNKLIPKVPELFGENYKEYI